MKNNILKPKGKIIELFTGNNITLLILSFFCRGFKIRESRAKLAGEILWSKAKYKALQLKKKEFYCYFACVLHYCVRCSYGVLTIKVKDTLHYSQPTNIWVVASG